MFHSFYIHWPFCPYRCHFCPFVAFAGQDSLMGQYHSALVKEMHDFAHQQDAMTRLETIYFGGGTPSTYPNELLLDMFDTLRKMAYFDDRTEVTIEVNPGTITKDALEFWKRLGINRLSIGIQSLNEKVLKQMNRLQMNADVYCLLEHSKNMFDNVSVDLILGLPNVSVQEWKDQLKHIMHWPIQHISIYFLTIHEFTPLFYRVKKNDIELPHDDEVVDLYCWSIELLTLHGFEQYEVSSFARKGFQSKHNKAYWQRKPYRGFGVGAWSFDGASRFRNKKNMALYMKGIHTGDVRECYETLSDEQVALETIMLHLRQKEGLLVHDYYNLIASDKKDLMHTRIDQFKRMNLLVEKDGRLQLTVHGCALEQKIIAELTS